MVACVCLFMIYTVEDRMKSGTFRMWCVVLLVIVRWVGSPLTSSEPVEPTGPTFSSRALT